MSVELAARAFFRYSVPISRRPSKLRIDGNLGEWGEDTRLPDLGELDGRPGFGEVHLAWDDAGLYLALQVDDKTSVTSHRQHPRNADAFFVWIDTRDVRDVQRASRFCHQFVALPRGGGGDRKSATAWQIPIRRAREQSPICDPKKLKVSSKVTADGYGLELFLPAAALNGYDPSACPRPGFTYLICDHEHGWQTWSVPGRLPFDHNPSTWATVELQGIPLPR